jgi:beta-lactamase class D
MIMFLLVSGCSNTGKTTTVPDTEMKNVKTVIEDLSSYFTGYEGCFILFDKNKNEYAIYNELKSNKQISPCSTFKIMNSLVGLETNVVQNENTVFQWDAAKKYSTAWGRSLNYNGNWNDDQTLQSAIANSIVWYFQELASRVGKDRMQECLDKANYGNKNISGGITKFWLQSSLKISPKEQVDFLKKLYDYELPFSKRNIDIVKKIIVLTNENGIVLSGKTGTGGKSGEYINGWFIGFIEKNENVYFFAANIEAKSNASGVRAREIAMQILKDKSLL